MKLYRATPDQLGNLSWVKGFCEDACYKMGYINDSKVRVFSLDGFELDPNILYRRPAGKFFYKEPWDAVFCSSRMHGGYNLVRILEYEFPDEIVNKSIRGFGLYSGRYVPEAKIPYEVLEKEGVLETPLDPELEAQLRKTKFEILRESLELYKTVKQWPQSKSPVERIEQILNEEPETCDAIHNIYMKELKRLIKCPYITGRTFAVTRQHRYDMIDDEFLIPYSNGVLTKENYEEWKNTCEKVYRLECRYHSLHDVDWK